MTTPHHHYTMLDLGEVNRPYRDELIAAATAVITSGRYVGGPEVDAFESELAAAVGVKYAVGVANGLDALRLTLRAYMELGRLHGGDEVIVPANSFIASALAVSESGLRVRFADVDPATSNIDWARLPLSPRTRAVMPVHLYGRVAEIPAEISDQFIVIEDNAQAIGATDAAGRHTGSLGHAAGMSFYPTKNVGALGDAGAVTTNDADVAAAVRSLANYGSSAHEHYLNPLRGVNSRLDSLQAAMLRVKLRHLDEENALRRTLAHTYLGAITNPAVELPLRADGHVWHQFVVRTAHRDQFRNYLLAHGVETGVHYPVALHRQPCYAEECTGLSLPVAERLAAQVVSLPISRCTSPEDALKISEIINSFSE